MTPKFFLSLTSVIIVIYLVVFIPIRNAGAPGASLDVPTMLRIGDVVIHVEVADTDEERTRGLSGREWLAEGEGMFFVFDKASRYSFWMKDMKFPLDIIWIGDNLVIVDITENADPSSYPTLFRPKQEARYVLEVNAGFAKEHELLVGDIAAFK